MKNKRLLNIWLIVFIDLLGFGLILPLLPFLAEGFGISEGTIGLIVASYPAAQMIGAPLLGRLSDKYGRRPILLVSILGTAAGYLLLGFANSVALLFLSRIVDGLTGGNISVAQAYITDITDEKNRARGLGMIGAAFGLGFIIGPAIGGVLSKNGFLLPALVATGFATISFLGVLFWLPESLTEEAKAQLASRPPRRILNLRQLIDALQRPRVGPLLTLRIGEGFAFNTFQTIFSLYALHRFGVTTQEAGFILAYIGLLVVLVQGVGIGPLAQRFEESHLLVASMVLLGIALYGYAAAPSIPFLLVDMIPMALGAGIFNTVINTSLSKAVYPEEIGGTLGLSAGGESFTRVFSPAASGYLLGINSAIPGLLGGTLAALLVPYAYIRLIARPDPPLPARGDGSPTATRGADNRQNA